MATATAALVDAAVRPSVVIEAGGKGHGDKSENSKEQFAVQHTHGIAANGARAVDHQYPDETQGYCK